MTLRSAAPKRVTLRRSLDKRQEVSLIIQAAFVLSIILIYPFFAFYVSAISLVGLLVTAIPLVSIGLIFLALILTNAISCDKSGRLVAPVALWLHMSLLLLFAAVGRYIGSYTFELNLISATLIFVPMTLLSQLVVFSYFAFSAKYTNILHKNTAVLALAAMFLSSQPVLTGTSMLGILAILGSSRLLGLRYRPLAQLSSIAITWSRQLCELACIAAIVAGLLASIEMTLDVIDMGALLPRWETLMLPAGSILILISQYYWRLDQLRITGQ